LRFNRDKIGSPPQFVSVGVERVCFESVDHLQPHRQFASRCFHPISRKIKTISMPTLAGIGTLREAPAK
jgi:hypothetical protein